jgi:hypothetical protein
MKRLIALLEGRWNCRVTHEPNPQMPHGATSLGWEESRVGPGGSSILFDTRAVGEFGTFEGAGFITRNAVNGAYDLYSLTSSSPEPGVFTGRWSDANVVFEGYEYVAGQRFASRHSITDIRAEEFVYSIEMGSTAGDWIRTATIKYMRASLKFPTH